MVALSEDRLTDHQATATISIAGLQDVIRKREDNARGGGFLIGAGAGLFVGFALGFLVTWAVL